MAVAPQIARRPGRARRFLCATLLVAASCATPKTEGTDAQAGTGGGGSRGTGGGAGGMGGAGGTSGGGGTSAGGSPGSGGATASGGAGGRAGNAGGGSGGAAGTGGKGGTGTAGAAGAAGAGGVAGAAGAGGVAGMAGAGGAPLATAPVWSWTGVVGTGQSLAVGGQGNATPTPIGATTQPFHNLKLSLGSVSVPPWPMPVTTTGLSMVALVEPLRTITTTYPSAYPKNIYGESVHTAMSDELTSLATAAGKSDYVSAHTEVGEAGQPLSVISKGATDTGTTGRAYAASLFEVGAIAKLAKAQGKTYGVGAILLNHGESDAASTTYESDMVTLWSNYNQDLPPLTGQTFAIPMLLSQQHSNPTNGGATSPATIAQWKIGVDHPGQIICTGPKYQYSYVSDFTHLIDKDYERLGEKDAQVYYQRVVLGNDWQPLQPTGASRSGQVITVTFNVPHPPLAWDTTLPAPHAASNTAWSQGKGFEVLSGTTPVTISSVAIAGSSVQITVAGTLPASGVTVAYAFTADSAPRANGTIRWGLLHDSDPFVGYLTGLPGQNYALAFQMTVP
ncbi:MAG TPA: dockerin [Polyangia bacterium]